MAHVNVLPTDFTHPLKRAGMFSLGEKQVLTRIFRALGGKTVQNGNATTVNASTTQTNVSGLSFKVRKGKQYKITGTLLVSTGATPGIAAGLALAGSSSPTMNVIFSYNAAAASATQAITSFTNSTGGAAAYLIVYIDGYFIPDVSGIMTVTFAQNTSNASNTIVKEGSSVSVYRTFS